MLWLINLADLFENVSKNCITALIMPFIVHLFCKIQLVFTGQVITAVITIGGNNLWNTGFDRLH